MSRAVRARALRAVVGVAVAAFALVPSVADAASPKTLRTGFMDDAVLGMPDGDRAAWLGRATNVGASVMRVNLYWNTVAPTRPPTGSESDPTWAGYSFAGTDARVKAAVAAGMTPLLNVSRSASWAQEPGQPKSFVSYPGAWKPDPVAFGQFMSAVARRYSGTTPDPAAPGQMLPKVTDFQIWNEPNLNLYLGPQYENGKPFAPIRWRELVNAGYASIKAVQPGANVVAAGLAPFGDPVSANAVRTRPVAFLRSATCLGVDLKRACGDVLRADTVSLHPYAVDRPGRSAYNGDDATIPDVNRINDVVRAARKAGTIGPKLPKTWVTEVSYDSSPPDPKGVPLATRARYISETMWRLWRADVSTVVWYLMRDDAPTPNYESTYQSGIFYRDGRRKADARAFRFPTLVTSKGAKNLNVWFRTPVAGTVSVQVQRGGRWVTAAKVKRLLVDGVGTTKVPRARTTAVRAVAGSATSYAWNVP